MNPTKVCLVLIGVVACLSVAQAAGGIKGGAASQGFGIKSGLRPPQPPQAFIPIAPQAPVARPPPPFRPAPLVPQVPIFEFPRPQPPVKRPPPTPTGPIFTPIPLPVFEAKRPQTPVITIQQEPLPAPVQQVPVQVIQVQQQQQQLQQEQVQEQVSDSEPDAQTQAQQEVDPNAAAQDSSAAVVGPPRPAGAAAASEEAEEANPRPEPYSFQYSFDASDSATSGSSQRSETQDPSGKVTGFYTLRGEDGRDRRVDYIADASGFRAVISTNEMGTAPKDSADVDWNANGPTEAQIRVAESATQAARARAPVAPISQLPASSFQQVTKVSSPRKNGAAASQQQQVRTQQSAESVAVSQLQEPFEQIRQTEFNTRARKSRHAPFYLYTV